MKGWNNFEFFLPDKISIPEKTPEDIRVLCWVMTTPVLIS
jgi:hypothetical protein